MQKTNYTHKGFCPTPICVYVHVYIYVCIYIYICRYTHIQMYIYTYMYINIYLHGVLGVAVRSIKLASSLPSFVEAPC